MPGDAEVKDGVKFVYDTSIEQYMSDEIRPDPVDEDILDFNQERNIKN